MTYSYNQTIEYIDGTRDLNFEAARKWARENGATFEEDMDARVTVDGVLKRYFVIGAETEKPAPIEPPPVPEPTQEEKEQSVRNERNLKLTFTDWTQLSDSPLAAEQKTEYAAYRQYLRDYTKEEDWYEQNPMTFEEWKQALEEIIASGD